MPQGLARHGSAGGLPHPGPGRGRAVGPLEKSCAAVSRQILRRSDEEGENVKSPPSISDGHDQGAVPPRHLWLSSRGIWTCGHLAS
eukprot:1601645-Amphidinium_carterae.2